MSLNIQNSYNDVSITTDCFLNSKKLNDVFIFLLDTLESSIETFVRSKLLEIGYNLD